MFEVLRAAVVRVGALLDSGVAGTLERGEIIQARCADGGLQAQCAFGWLRTLTDGRPQLRVLPGYRHPQPGGTYSVSARCPIRDRASVSSAAVGRLSVDDVVTLATVRRNEAGCLKVRVATGWVSWCNLRRVISTPSKLSACP